jgi:hypothetical protein
MRTYKVHRNLIVFQRLGTIGNITFERLYIEKETRKEQRRKWNDEFTLLATRIRLF